MEYNIYCDESCHLENDGINVMVIGGIWCPKNKIKDINLKIKSIKESNGIPEHAELKWTKVAPVKKQVYEDIIDYFFDNNDLHFRAVVIADKSKLDHERFEQTHDDWYYKMYFNMLKVIFNPKDTYSVYIDIKDTMSSYKSKKLHDVCSNNIYDFSKSVIKKIQPIRSHEIQIMQLTDILIGALGYANRNFPQDFIKSNTKLKLVEKIINKSGYKLTKSTLYREDKFNLFLWDSNVRKEEI